MSVKFSYRLLVNWFDALSGRTRPEISALAAHQVLLLLSDGSMTYDLELLYGAPTEAAVLLNKTSSIAAAASKYLQVEAEEEAVERIVWLKVNGKKLVYAHSIIPLASVSVQLLKELDARSDEPLGRVLISKKIFFTKDRLEVAVVKCESAERALGLKKDTPLMARRYILSGGKGRSGEAVKAAVTEIFSPEVITARI